MDNNCFEWPVRIYIEDTDAGGIVFYANYLKFFERARTEMVRSLGVELRQGLERGISYVVHSAELKFLSPARLDDEILVTAEVEKLGKTYMLFDQAAKAECGKVLATARVKVACIDYPSMKPRPLEENLISAIKTKQQGKSSAT